MAETRVLTQYDEASKGQKKFSPLTYTDSVFHEDGKLLSKKLNELDARLLEGYTFIERANFDTNPGVPRSKVYYIATEVGTYKYFKENPTMPKSIEITKEGTYAFMYDPKNAAKELWVVEELQLHLTTDKVFDNPTQTKLSESLITSVNVDEIEDSILTNVLVKTEQTLSPNEKKQVQTNIGLDEKFEDILSKITDGYKYMGIATPTSSPVIQKGRYYYVATENGTYGNYGNINIIEKGLYILKYDGSWKLDNVLKTVQTIGNSQSDLMSQDAITKEIYTLITSEKGSSTINDIEETLVSNALRKTPQNLNEDEKAISRKNIGVDKVAKEINDKIDINKDSIIGINEKFNGNIEYDNLSKGLKDIIEAGGSGSITNNPDGEDLESINIADTDYIREKTVKDYNPLQFSGLGKVILRRKGLKVDNRTTTVLTVSTAPTTVGELVVTLGTDNYVIGCNHLYKTAEGRFVIKKDLRYYYQDNGEEITEQVSELVDTNKMEFDTPQKLAEAIHEKISADFKYKSIVADNEVTLVRMKLGAVVSSLTNPTGAEISTVDNSPTESIMALTQDMFEIRVGEPRINTRYIIRYDFFIEDVITLPENCALIYDGGSIRGGKLVYNNTMIDGIELLDVTKTEGEAYYPDKVNTDEEDLSYNGGYLLQLANRHSGNGMGYKILRKKENNGKRITTILKVVSAPKKIGDITIKIGAKTHIIHCGEIQGVDSNGRLLYQVKDSKREVFRRLNDYFYSDNGDACTPKDKDNLEEKKVIEYSTANFLANAIGECVNMPQHLYSVAIKESTLTIVNFKLEDNPITCEVDCGETEAVIEKPVIKSSDETIFELTSDDFKDSSTIYEIRYNFDLNGNKVSIPSNCTLYYNGGQINNGELEGNETIIDGTFSGSAYLVGSFKNAEFELPTDTDVSELAQDLLDRHNFLSFGNGTYYLSKPIIINDYQTIKGTTTRRTIIKPLPGCYTAFTTEIDINESSTDHGKKHMRHGGRISDMFIVGKKDGYIPKYGIYIKKDAGFVISRVDIINCEYGVYLRGWTNTLYAIQCTYNKVGIWLSTTCNQVLVQFCEVLHNNYGIVSSGASYGQKINQCNISSSKKAGLVLTSVHDVEVSSCYIEGNGIDYSIEERPTAGMISHKNDKINYDFKYKESATEMDNIVSDIVILGCAASDYNSFVIQTSFSCYNISIHDCLFNSFRTECAIMATSVQNLVVKNNGFIQFNNFVDNPNPEIQEKISNFHIVNWVATKGITKLVGLRVCDNYYGNKKLGKVKSFYIRDEDQKYTGALTYISDINVESEDENILSNNIYKFNLRSPKVSQPINDPFIIYDKVDNNEALIRVKLKKNRDFGYFNMFKSVDSFTPKELYCFEFDIKYYIKPSKDPDLNLNLVYGNVYHIKKIIITEEFNHYKIYFSPEEKKSLSVTFRCITDYENPDQESEIIVRNPKLYKATNHYINTNYTFAYDPTATVYSINRPATIGVPVGYLMYDWSHNKKVGNFGVGAWQCIKRNEEYGTFDTWRFIYQNNILAQTSYGIEPPKYLTTEDVGITFFDEAKRQTYTWNGTNFYKYDGTIYTSANYGNWNNKPNTEDVPEGYSYYCTDKKSPERGSNGLMMFRHAHTWIDSSGREVNENYPARYKEECVFDRLIEDAEILSEIPPNDGIIIYIKSKKIFALKVGDLYYDNSPIHSMVGKFAIKGKVYVTAKDAYIRIGENLTKITTGPLEP